jgi:hypothetical protein
MSTTRTDKGHPGLWWQGGPVPDECPEVRELCDLTKVVPPQRPIPNRDQILARGSNRG